MFRGASIPWPTTLPNVMAMRSARVVGHFLALRAISSTAPMPVSASSASARPAPPSGKPHGASVIGPEPVPRRNESSGRRDRPNGMAANVRTRILSEHPLAEHPCRSAPRRYPHRPGHRHRIPGARLLAHRRQHLPRHHLTVSHTRNGWHGGSFDDLRLDCRRLGKRLFIVGRAMPLMPGRLPFEWPTSSGTANIGPYNPEMGDAP